MKHYKNRNLYVAILGDNEIGVNLNDSIDTAIPLGIDYYVNNGFKEITHDEFCKAYRQTMAIINSAFSRLNMMYTDANIDKATEADKEEERERLPADDVHRGEHMEFEC
jgi:hypothetical protein